MKTDVKVKIRELSVLTFGSLLVAIGVYFFKYPNHFSTGGVSGLSVLLGKMLPFLTPATYVLMINGIFLVLGFTILNRSFGYKTVYCSVVFSLTLRLFEILVPMKAPLTDQPLLELFFAVIFPAIGSAILFHSEASTGGTDILAMILKKYTSLNIGRALLCSDVLIAAATLVVFDIKTGLFSLLGLLLKSVLVDSVIENINQRKSVTIITQNPHCICTFITENLKRSATIWTGEGAYTEERRYIVLSALNNTQAAALRKFVKMNDPAAFILISNTSEVFGKGFLRT